MFKKRAWSGGVAQVVEKGWIQWHTLTVLNNGEADVGGSLVSRSSRLTWQHRET
jgi:hypothetical protein